MSALRVPETDLFIGTRWRSRRDPRRVLRIVAPSLVITSTVDRYRAVTEPGGEVVYLGVDRLIANFTEVPGQPGS